MLDQGHEAELAFGGQVIRLREWGTDCTYELPSRPSRGWCIGASSTCPLRLTDPDVALKHAELFDERGQWHIRDLPGTTGIRQDGEPRKEFVLTPGVEISIGVTTLIAESERSIAFREFCARLLGWGTGRMCAVDQALRALRLAAARRSTLVLQGDEDPVPLAHALHRRVLGPAARFIVCDPRRREVRASSRSPANVRSAVMALEDAAGGSLCVRSRRLPDDLPELTKLLDAGARRVQLIVCMDSHERSRRVAYPMPIEVPPIGIREIELPRIIQAYAEDALTELCATPSCFSREDHDWVSHKARSLSEIEKATLRIVALNKAGNLHRAARLLGMAGVSLSRWLGRREVATRRVSQVGLS
jgi:hypothetical protein